jgi:hypothetical protein
MSASGLSTAAAGKGASINRWRSHTGLLVTVLIAIAVLAAFPHFAQIQGFCRSVTRCS